MSRAVSRIGTPVVLVGGLLFALTAFAENVSGTPFSDNMVIILAVQIVGVLTQIGITSWLKWSIEKISEDKASEAVELHNDRRDAHFEASAENHAPIRASIIALEKDLTALREAHLARPTFRHAFNKEDK